MSAGCGIGRLLLEWLRALEWPPAVQLAIDTPVGWLSAVSTMLNA